MPGYKIPFVCEHCGEGEIERQVKARVRGPCRNCGTMTPHVPKNVEDYQIDV